MSSLALFAETPRAGEHGHRFLVAANAQPSEPQIAEFLEAAEKDVSVGMNFIGVGRSVRQLSGTAVRTGREIIILAGVDVSQIPGPSRDRLLALLRELLDRLEHLVLRRIDWSRLPRAELVIRSAELGQWLDEIQALQLPETEWQGGPRPLATVHASPTSKRGSQVPPALLGYALLASLIAILIGVCVWLRGTAQNGDNGIAVHQSPEPRHGPIPSDSERAIRKLAAEWDCSLDDVVRSLLRAANWDRRREADSLSLETGVRDGEVRLLLGRVTSKDGVEQLLVSAAIDSEPDFRRYAMNYPSSPVTASRRLRKWLYDASDKWNRLHRAVVNASEPLSSAENGDVLARMMVVVARLQPDVGVGDEFRDPVTPLFDRQDVMIWHFLNQCRVTMEDHGINQFLGKTVASPPTSESAYFFAALSANRDAIVSTLAGSRALTTDKVRKAQGKENGEAVFVAYAAFEDFIEHLAGLESRQLLDREHVE